MQPLRTFLLFLASLSLLLSSSLVANERPKPMTFVKGKTDAVLKLLNQRVKDKSSQNKRNADLRTLIASFVDYDDLAQRSLGKHWGGLSEENQTLYRSLFRELVELSYVDRLGRRNPDVKYEIDWEGQSTKGDTGRVTCFILYQDTETELDFFLKAQQDTWILHDLHLDGASIEDTYRRKYGDIIEKDGFDELIRKMREQIAELKAKE